MFILFSYQCSFMLFVVVFYLFVFRNNLIILSCLSNIVNNFFQLFFDSFSLFQRRPLKLTVFAVLLLSFATALLDYHMIFCLSTCFLNYFLCFFNSIRKPQYLDMDWSLLTQFLLHALQKMQTDFA